MHGEIIIQDLLKRQADLRRWQERQQRNAEWIALKQWWRAERAVRRAATEQQRRLARRDRAKTVELYREALLRAWPKWRQAHKRHRGSLVPTDITDYP